jgi:hypothetical protein
MREHLLKDQANADLKTANELLSHIAHPSRLKQQLSIREQADQ